MRIKLFFLSLLIILFPIRFVAAQRADVQIIIGKVYDVVNNEPLEDVEIVNIHANKIMFTVEDGLFSIEAKKGDLIEFRKIGYKIGRVRLSSEKAAPYYNVGLAEGPFEINEIEIFSKGKAPSWYVDSMRTVEVFKKEIEFYKLEGADIMKHPFDAMSKRNRRIWEFQKRYEMFEREKYIDWVFSEKTIYQLTKLEGDSVHVFQRLYRPYYYQLDQWTTYQYYDYIKKSVAEFRKYKLYEKHKNE